MFSVSHIMAQGQPGIHESLSQKVGSVFYKHKQCGCTTEFLPTLSLLDMVVPLEGHSAVGALDLLWPLGFSYPTGLTWAPSG